MNEVKRFMRQRGLRINWLASQIGMKPKTLYPKLDGSRGIRDSELAKINAVLGTTFEGEQNGSTKAN